MKMFSKPGDTFCHMHDAHLLLSRINMPEVETKTFDTHIWTV